MNTKQLMGKNANYDSICPNTYHHFLDRCSFYLKTARQRKQILPAGLKSRSISKTSALQHKPETQGRGRTRPPDGWMRIGGRDETVIRPHHQSSRFLSLSTRCCICSSLTTIWVTEKRIQ